jgi:hypothetical protein
MAASFVRFAVFVTSVTLMSPALGAQSLASAQSRVPPRDSSGWVTRARAAQAGFERFRFQRLPRTVARGGGKCDETIGRFCFWFEADPDPEPPQPEEPAVGVRRGALIQTLHQAADAVPGDSWLAGQRVRYLVEAGEEDEAVAAARACRAEAWWCSALQGYALHEAQRFGEAEQAFAAALAAMPAEDRARWTDVSELLSPEDQRLLRRLPPAERDRLARRLWWLADPLWSDEGNDRLTEHYARWTMHHIQLQSRQVDRTAWRDDTREVVVRYGWFVAWERYVPLYYGYTGEGVIAYNEPRTWEWLPPLAAAREPARLRGDEWPLVESVPTATRYAPEYASHVSALPHQKAVFPRPTGAVLVAGYALDPDSVPAEPRIRAAAVAMDDAGGASSVSPWQPTAASGSLWVDLPTPRSIVSLEVREDSTRLLARWRGAVAVDVDAPVSDLLLLAHPDARPETLEDAARIARGSAEVRAGESVGVFWEMYGLAAADSVTVRVGLMAPRAGWARRQLEAIGVARGAHPTRMGWSEVAGADGVAPRSLAVAIPADLRPGEYTLEVTVDRPGHPAATARRTITVRREP